MRQPHSNSFAILFVARKSKKSNDQLLLNVRITINGQRSEFSIQRTIPTSQWD